MAEFQKPAGWRFAFGGVNLRSAPDAIDPGKQACAVNVRATSDNSIHTRPGFVPLFSSGASRAITDLRTYAGLGTDDRPRIIARDEANHLILDDGQVITTLNSPTGLGVSMIPFRPSASPQSWMYVAGQGDYLKLSVPSANNSVTTFKVGIAEPQAPLDAAPAAPIFQDFTNSSNNGAAWTAGGTASGLSSGLRISDTASYNFADNVVPTRFSVVVGANKSYQTGELLTFSGNNSSTEVVVQDVIPPTVPLTILGVRYDAGNSGSCTIVPSQVPIGEEPAGLPQLGFLRRGALVTLTASNNSSETVLIRGTASGPNGALSFQTVTGGTYAPGNGITGNPTIVVDGASSGTITGRQVSFTQASGIGYITQNLSPNPLTQIALQNDDYLHVSVYISDPTQIAEIQIQFNVDPTDTTFTQNYYYYSVDESVLLAAGEDQWTEVLFPISALTRVGNNQTVTMANCKAVRIWINAALGSWEPLSAYVLGQLILDPSGHIQKVTVAGTSGSVEPTWNDSGGNTSDAGVTWTDQGTGGVASTTIAIGSLWAGGGSQPDVGDTGAPYQYVAVPRSSLTGAQGNPTPIMRYGVSPRRQSVTVVLPSAAYDPQIDTWDVYRYGGSVTSYRYIGSTLASSATFTDNMFDDTATAGAQVSQSNFEPWPSIDQPFQSTGSIVVTGTEVVVTDTTVAWPSTITSWLPGTLIQLGGIGAFTLYTRPTLLSATSYLFELVECAGYIPGASSFIVAEPDVARQFAPYMDGPDAYGTFFAVGERLRPGGVYFAASNAPDEAPQTNFRELCAPSEPLLRPFVLQTITLVASTDRWWALYPNFSQAGTYTPIEQPVGRGIISPWGCCKDGQRVYFWAKDGICATSGGAFESLTDADLYNLFPHEGVQGQGSPLSGLNIVRYGITYYAPDYSRSAQFRLSYVNKMLFATYLDYGGTRRTLVCDLRTGAWSQDIYAAGSISATTFYAPEQQSGTVLSSGTLYPAMVMGDTLGNVYEERNYVNDNGVPIPCTVATFEWDGGDRRAQQQFGDGYVDCYAVYPVAVTPVSLGSAVAPATVISARGARVFAPISVGGALVAKYLGLLFTWTDDFSQQEAATTLHLWQLSVVAQPEITLDRFGEWTNCGRPGNKYFQGILVHADTFNKPKNIQIRDSDTNTLHVLQPALMQHNGEKTVPYSFVAPFVAHEVREEPQDLVPWRKWGIEYVFQPTPEAVQSWITQLSALSGKGYMTIPRIEAAWAATQPVTLTITAFDGTSPAVLTLPSTTGAYQKLLLTLTANKGMMYQFSATSPAPFQLWLPDWIVWVGAWGRTSELIPYRNLGGPFGDKAEI
jgi:hypothetical protein